MTRWLSLPRGPIGLCATAGAKLKGGSLIIAVESDPARAEMAKRMGADVIINHLKMDEIAEIRRLTGGEGVDAAIEALGTRATFKSALRVLRVGGTLSSLGVYSGKLSVPVEPFAAGLGNQKTITTLCPGRKERMRRLMELVRHGKLDLTPLLTHTFSLDEIAVVYKLFAERRDGVNKIAIKPQRIGFGEPWRVYAHASSLHRLRAIANFPNTAGGHVR